MLCVGVTKRGEAVAQASPDGGDGGDGGDGADDYHAAIHSILQRRRRSMPESGSTISWMIARLSPSPSPSPSPSRYGGRRSSSGPSPSPSGGRRSSSGPSPSPSGGRRATSGGRRSSSSPRPSGGRYNGTNGPGATPSGGRRGSFSPRFSGGRHAHPGATPSTKRYASPGSNPSAGRRSSSSFSPRPSDGRYTSSGRYASPSPSPNPSCGRRGSFSPRPSNGRYTSSGRYASPSRSPSVGRYGLSPQEDALILAAAGFPGRGRAGPDPGPCGRRHSGSGPRIYGRASASPSGGRYSPGDRGADGGTNTTGRYGGGDQAGGGPSGGGEPRGRLAGRPSGAFPKGDRARSQSSSRRFSVKRGRSQPVRAGGRSAMAAVGRSLSLGRDAGPGDAGAGAPSEKASKGGKSRRRHENEALDDMRVPSPPKQTEDRARQDNDNDNDNIINRDGEDKCREFDKSRKLLGRRGRRMSHQPQRKSRAAAAAVVRSLSPGRLQGGAVFRDDPNGDHRAPYAMLGSLDPAEDPHPLDNDEAMMAIPQDRLPVRPSVPRDVDVTSNVDSDNVSSVASTSHPTAKKPKKTMSKRKLWRAIVRRALRGRRGGSRRLSRGDDPVRAPVPTGPPSPPGETAARRDGRPAEDAHRDEDRDENRDEDRDVDYDAPWIPTESMLRLSGLLDPIDEDDSPPWMPTRSILLRTGQLVCIESDSDEDGEETGHDGFADNGNAGGADSRDGDPVTGGSGPADGDLGGPRRPSVDYFDQVAQIYLSNTRGGGDAPIPQEEGRGELDRGT